MRSEKEAHLIDPEPFSTILVVLGAIGSIASIYAVIEQRSTSARVEREANRFAFRDALMGVETGLNELRSYIHSLEMAFAVGARRRGDHDPLMSMAGFGNVSLAFSRDGHERWREIEDGILRSVGRVQHSMGELMRHFAMTKFKLPPDSAQRLQNSIEKLNFVEELFRLLDETANECMDTLRQIRFDFGGFLRETP